MHCAVLHTYLIAVYVILSLSYSPIDQVSHPCNEVGIAEVLRTFGLVCFGAYDGFKVLSIIPVTCRSFDARVVPKVMSNIILHANWEQQTKESAVVDGTSFCVILECLVTSIACIT